MRIVRVLDKMSTINSNPNKVSFLKFYLSYVVQFDFIMELHYMFYIILNVNIMFRYFDSIVCFFFVRKVLLSDDIFSFIMNDSLWVIWWLVLNYSMKIPFFKLNIFLQIKKRNVYDHLKR